MAASFLHRFLSSVTRIGFEHQPAGAGTHDWPLSLVSVDGPSLLSFTIMGIGDTPPRQPGIFIYARRRAGQWQALYIGETGNLRARLSFNEIAADALLSGATDIHILPIGVDAAVRRDLTESLVAIHRPPLNEEERVRLAGLMAQGSKPAGAQPGGTTRAA